MVSEEEDDMRTLVICMIIAAAIPWSGTMAASAMPAEGAAIARLGQQVTHVLDVKAKKKAKTRTSAPTAPPPREPSQSNY